MYYMYLYVLSKIQFSNFIEAENFCSSSTSTKSYREQMNNRIAFCADAPICVPIHPFNFS